MTAAQSSVDRYLELVRRVLLDQVDPRPELIPVEPTGVLKRAAVRLLGERGLELVRRRTYDPARRAQGKGWPQYGYTMVGEERLLNLERCVRTALGEQVPGDLAETGVWRGGASIYMRAILAAYGVTDRRSPMAGS